MTANRVVREESANVFRLVVPPDGGWSLTPIENLLRGLRNMSDQFSMEIYGGGTGGAVSYLLRSTSGTKLQGLIQSYFPQARSELLKADGKGVHGDWLRLGEDENALVMPLWLGEETYLPIKTYQDHVLREGEFDPLAGVIAHLSGIGRWTGGDSRDRIGMRLLLHPAREDWSRNYQSKIQARRDGDDRNGGLSGRSDSGASNAGAIGMGALMALGAVGYFNYDWFQSGEYLRMAALDAAAVGIGALGFWGWRRSHKKKSRAYLDEELVEEKIKSLGFHCEVQLIRTYAGGDVEREGAKESLTGFVDVLRQFDHPAGNCWKSGPVKEFTGLDLGHERGDLGLSDPTTVMKWVSQNRAKRSVMSAREVATLWHMPLGMNEMASMDRGQSKVLTPYLEGLDEEGPLVGYTDHGLPVRLPESALEKHTLFLGRSGTGKSTMVKQVVYFKMIQKARGADDGAIVVVDPHADLVRDILRVVPPEIAHKVRLLDLGRDDRVPAINLMDPYLFPDRDRCVGTIIETLKGLWESWGNRLEEILDRGLKMIYEYNVHPDTPRPRMLTMLDLLRLLQDGKVSGQGRNQTVELSEFQKHVLERVEDAYVQMWFKAFMNWPRDTRAEALGPVMNRIGAYAADGRAKAVLGQRESTVVFSDILKDGIILLVSTASGTIGQGPAALMGGTVVSLLDSALREQEKLAPADRKKCLLIADEFQTITGTNWEAMLAEIRKYKCSLMLATQSLAVLDSPERNLKSGIMSNTACLISYQISAEDAQLVSYQLGHERVSESDLVMLDPFCCYVRITTVDKALPVFSMRTLPPPEYEHGDDSSVSSVVENMKGYTVDRQEALKRINDEALEAMQGLDDKISMSGESVGAVRDRDGAVAVSNGAGVNSGVNSNANGMNVAVGNEVNAYGAMFGAKKKSAGNGSRNGKNGSKGEGVSSGSMAERIAGMNLKGDVAKALNNISEEDLRASIFSVEVLAKLYEHARGDKAARGLLDDRLRGRVQKAIGEKEREFERTLDGKEREINRLNNELEQVKQRIAAGKTAAGVSLASEVTSIVGDSENGLPRDVGKVVRRGRKSRPGVNSR